ncbi:sensor histidine kinase [Actinokineospora auranticolor]|uniref:Anti-sigma regulatory factor (Ser/Thr protein kinase) n=1 Tax=Actinokineospora auranticolor TaxID=155976 RepID=A0A2S6GDA9_9PSEU|nr:sensor histidine kinase [Actinokineospora auranticolor]PPK63101.1 anti-sigma regulatory factor (Ser/Thr protein kinase) [Actinokineospora auranticolor]
MTADHTALLYRGAVEYLAAVLPFVRDGVAAGEAVTVAAPRGNLDLVRDECGAEGLADRVRWLDMAEVGRNPGRIVSAVLHPLLARGGRVVTEVVWPGRPSAQYPACVRHEALANDVIADRPLRLLCPYDAELLPASALADAVGTHPALLRRGAAETNPEYAPDVALETYNRMPDDPAAADGAREISVGVGELGDARAMVSAAARAHGLDEQRVGDTALVVTELVTNSIEHGGGRAELRVWSRDGELVCQVRDGGTLADPLAGLRPAPVDQAHGRGLLLVHTLADLVTLHADEHGTVVRAHFALPSGA